MNSRNNSPARPQRLKPRGVRLGGGPAEAGPFPNPFMKHALTGFEMFSLNLKEHSCLKDCFNRCICWLFSELPCLCSGPKSSPNLVKESERASAASRQP